MLILRAIGSTTSAVGVFVPVCEVAYNFVKRSIKI